MSIISDKLAKLAETIRLLWRAAHGQTLQDEQYQYLLDLNDIRERTILQEHDVYGHSAMRLGAQKYPELRMWGKIAEMEDHYFNSIDGEGKRIAATIAVGKRETTPTGVSIQLPTVQTQPVQPQEEAKKKGGWFKR
jgi:hypothetical protein